MIRALQPIVPQVVRVLEPMNSDNWGIQTSDHVMAGRSDRRRVSSFEVDSRSSSEIDDAKPKPNTTGNAGRRSSRPAVSSSTRTGASSQLPGVMSLLLVEDDRRLAASLAKGLEEDGYQVSVALTYSDGLGKARAGSYQAIILDVGLPDGNGIELARVLRSEGFDLPILMLTASADAPSVVAGLDGGADDYVVKPVPLAVLGARLRALHRRWYRPLDAPIRLGDLVLEPSRLLARRGTAEIDLTPTQARILQTLMLHSGNVLSRGQIADRISRDDPALFSNVIDVHIRALRTKIDEPFQSNMIETVRGLGYRMRRPVGRS